MRAALNRLGSIKLTLAILLLLAGASALGTFLPRGGDLEAWQKIAGNAGTRAAAALGLTDFYHSPWFSALLAVLVVNLLACMTNRVPAMLSSISGKAAMGREAVIDLPDTDESEMRVASALRSLGFTFKARGDRRIFTRGASAYAWSLLTHGSILVILAFSILGSAAGFIATQRVYVGDSITTAFDWKAGADRALPFEVRADDFTLMPNPVGVRLGVLHVATQRRGKAITTHEGSTFAVPGVRGRVRLESFDVERKDFLATWTAADGSRVEFGKDQEIGDTGISLVPVAFATWPERQAVAGVTLVSGDAVELPAEISVNHPMVTDGVRIYLTDYGKDRFGLPYVGFQFVRDPGQAGVWAGCILFLVCLPGTVWLRHSCAVIVRDEGRLKVHVSSRGNRDEIIEKLREKMFSGTGR